MPSPQLRASCDDRKVAADPSESLPTLASLGYQFLVRADGNFATLAGSHEGIRVCRVLKRKAVRNDVGGMQIPPYKALDQFLHQPGRRHPGPADGLLVVNDVGRRIELHR